MLSDVGPMFFSLGPFDIIFICDLVQYFIWLYIHVAIQLINNLWQLNVHHHDAHK